MKRKNIIIVLIIVVLIIALIIMTKMYFSMRESSIIGLESTLRAQDEVFQLNKKIQELEEEIINLKTNQTNTITKVEYYIEDDIYYADIEVKEKVKLISIEKACDIADKEAKKNIYQYQPWESDFYSRGEENNYQIAIELKNGINKDNSRWEEKWQKTVNYSDRLMWSVRLFDRNDPLTSLYIYVDAINGDILGAGKQSD